MNEVEKIKHRYRQGRRLPAPTANNSLFVEKSRNERETIMKMWLQKNLADLKTARALEIGAGYGDNLKILRRIGFTPENLFANELLEERVVELQKLVPREQILVGDICQADTDLRFEVILQSVVFSSILDYDFQRQVAKKMDSLLRPGGLLLWYDFTYNNPSNKHVKGIGFKQVKALFPNYHWLAKKWVTLAPPLGRRMAPWYDLLNNLLPFLRTHRLCLLQKPN